MNQYLSMNQYQHLTSQDPPASAINFDEFYAERVSSFEKERNLFERYLRLIKPEHNEAHDLEWESRNLIEESRLAEQTAKGVEDQLQQVQQEIAGVQREIQEMEHAHTLRQEQIDRLMLLARPVGRDVTYIYKEHFPVNHAVRTNKSKAAELKAAQAEQLDQTNMLFKTIKTGEVVKLEQRVHEETLRATTYLRNLQAAIRTVENERYEAKQSHHVVREEDVSAAEHLCAEVDRNENQCFFAVSELLRLRYRILVAQRQEVEELEQLHQEKESFVAKEEQTKRELLEEMSRLQRAAQWELMDVQRSFEQQLADLDSRIMHWRSKEQKLLSLKQKVHNNELKLQSRLQLAKQRYFALKKRNALEMEGYGNQLQQLRASLRKLDKMVHAKR